jgi:hypothetical protein
MPDHRYLHHARRCLPVLLAALLLAASAAAADSLTTPGNGTVKTMTRLAPGQQMNGYVTPDAVDGVSGTITRISSLPAVQPSENRAADAGVGGPVIVSVSPQIASAGTNTTITIAGTGFGRKASRTSPADIGFTSAGGVYWASGRTNLTANPDEIVSWSDTAIRVRVPTGFTGDEATDTASSGTLLLVTDAGMESNAMPFAVSFGVGRATWSDGPVFLVNDNCPGVAGGADAVRRAAATWNTALPAEFRIDCSGTTMSTAADPDDVSVIAWGSPSSATIWTDGNGTILEADILLYPGTTWTTGAAGGSQYSIESRMLETLGYCLGIASLGGEAAQGPSDAGKACSLGREDDLGNMNLVTLSPADRAAVAYLYGGGSANPPLLAAAFTADTIAGPAPLTVRFNDVSLGGATGWAWDFGDGRTSGEENPVHTYAAPGAYTVALTVSAAGYPDDTIRAIDRISITGAAVLGVPGGTGIPTSTVNNGRCDDVNGNLRKDFADVVLYFNQLSWIAANEPVSAFDYNGNGRIDFADVVWLFNNL